MNINPVIISTTHKHPNINDLLYLNKTLNLNKTVEELINLKRLNLRCNQMEEIPKEIGSLINLEILYLYVNKMEGNT